MNRARLLLVKASFLAVIVGAFAAAALPAAWVVDRVIGIPADVSREVVERMRREYPMLGFFAVACGLCALFAVPAIWEPIARRAGLSEEELREFIESGTIGPRAPDMRAAITDIELRLGRKLAETLHLDAGGRAALPGGELRLSAIVAAVDAALNEAPFFPPRVRGASDSFTGVVLERRADGSLWTHERHEIGVGRLSEVVSEPVASMQAAVERYFSPLGGYAIDGVRVNERA